ncbi:GlxA family transcriptional regulator [Croceicoccus bisphenolivorans]|uniref:GlxA family transcriptional regulator n=1 Tax=Croceicoccus bisphenolivorans TaxID=1783232 RepID=UPI000A9C6847|nr:GlxA family transcriptional regulator [Croceicoccus bisphenolivorans]
MVIVMTNMDDMSKKPRRTLGLLLIDGFALMSYASLIEPFRAANDLSGEDLYDWVHISVDGAPVAASNGATILADRKVGDPLACDTLFVFAAGDPAAFRDDRTFAWLRKLAREDVRIAGISGGPYLLARAGLLSGYRATIHWEHEARLADEFPLLVLESSLYVIDRRRLTCAGGVAGLDLAVDLIERDQGSGLATQVSEWFIRTETRTAERPQRLSLRDRYRVNDDTVLRALAVMEAEIEAPVPRELLARMVGVSPRQLDRLFQSALNQSATRAYLRIRLEKAEQLLRTTGLSVTEAGLACGFASASHFSRIYKQHFDMCPNDARRRPPFSPA